MLEWMQRHKKYLVITIWISVIALVSAGMVGWNPSGFSLTGDNIAKVGDIKISQQDFQNMYQRVFNEYNQMLGGNLDFEQAKTFGLNKIALNQLIQAAQLQSFAKDIGLRVNDEEVVKAITQDKIFMKNDVFDEKLYRQILRENNLSVKFFEQSVRNSLLIQKLLTLFPIATTPLEQKTIGSTMQITDTIEYKILELMPLKQKITQQQIQDFWEKNKEQYKKEAKATIEAILVDITKQPFTQEDLKNLYDEDKSLYLGENGELEPFEKVKDKIQYTFQEQEAKKQAIKLFQKLKEGDQNTQTITITLDAPEVSQELSEQLNNASEGMFIKPAPYNGSYYIIGKVTHFQPQSIKTLQEARKEVLGFLTKELQFEELKKEAAKQLDSFSGKIAKIDVLNQTHFDSLDANQSQIIIRNIFGSSQDKGVITLESSAFVYKIHKQVLPQDVPNNLLELVRNTKSQFIDKTLMEYLEAKYPKKVYNKQIFQ
ncbi:MULTISPECIES: peptidylprolyl isomerase [unclassified Helicobacter]|uniref:peptidylprolyl isomerase n=1 Tax=unclassified Helicobacter TaxID=2593540 RepID=UPI000CF0441C|nr:MULTISPECIES: peptidylprolyl isomerase [unclassified Helicobacter]